MEFDWEKEIKDFKEGQLISNYRILERTSNFKCIMGVSLLEGDELILDCCVQKGIEIVECAEPGYKGKCYESFEQIFSQISKAYVNNFFKL